MLLLALAASAQAARLIQAGLHSDTSGSHLVLTLDSRVDYNLDLLDPRTVVLRLPKTYSAAIMPRTANDPVIESITVNSNSQGLDLIIRTRAAGTTVQPSYNEAEHKLTLSFGGTAPAPLTAPPANATPSISELRVSGSGDKMQIHLNADQPLKGSLTSQGDIFFLRVEKGAMAAGMRIAADDSRVLAMQVENIDPFAVASKLSRPLGEYKLTSRPDGLVVDITLGGTKVMPPPPSTSAEPPQPSRPTSVAPPMPEISTAPPPEGPTPVQPPMLAPATPDNGLAPSQPAQVRGGRAYGALPPRPAEPDIAPARSGGVSVAESGPDEDGPPVTVGARQPQGASLAGRNTAPGADLDVARQLMDEGRYDEALYSYELLLRENTGYEQAAQASYGLAEAYFRLHQQDIVPYYTRIMDLYQSALINYPDFPELTPRALLMMGRAASLAEEFYLGSAYYHLVSTRYRRSEQGGWAQIYLGQMQLAQERWQEALKTFTDVLGRWQEGDLHREAEMGLLQTYFGMEQWENAANLIAGIMQREPDIYLRYPQILHYMGEALYQIGDYPLAREYLLWALNINPEITDGDIIMTRIADSYRMEKAYRAAGEIYNDTTMRFPNSPGSQVAKMRLSEEPEQDKEHPWEIFQVRPTAAAMRTYTDIAQLYADQAVGQLARLKMAVWYYKTAAFAYSLQTGAELLAQHPDTMFRPELDYLMDAAARARLQELREELNPVQLLSEYVRLRPYLKEPESNDILELMAWGYEQTGLSDKAAHLYKVLGSRQLYKPGYWVDAARNYFMDEDFEQTLETLREVNLDELDADKQKEFLFMEGVSLSRQGKYKQAVLTLLALLKKEPDNLAQVYQNLGFALGHLEGRALDALNALDLAEQAYAGQEDNSARLLVALQAGLLSKQAGDTQRALQYLQKALSLSQNEQDKAPILYEIFLNQRALGQTSQMRESLQQLVDMKADPWSTMAEAIMADEKLTPALERMGRQPEDGGN